MMSGNYDFYTLHHYINLIYLNKDQSTILQTIYKK